MKRCLSSWISSRARLRNGNRGTSRVLCAIVVVAGAALVAGCTTPFSIGLHSDIPSGGTTGTSTVVIETLPDQLWLTGSYDIQSGALTIDVRAPDDSTPFSRTFTAIAQGEIRESLQPMLGEWTITVSSAGGAGSYDVRLEY